MEYTSSEILSLIGQQSLQLHRQAALIAQLQAELAQAKRQIANLTAPAPADPPE